MQWLLVEPEILERERRARLRQGLRVDWVGCMLVALALGLPERRFRGNDLKNDAHQCALPRIMRFSREPHRGTGRA
jgi:hypothetical protein